MSVYLAPTFGVGYQAFNTNGAVLAGGLIYTYQAGSSTLQATYTTSTGSIANANPIILDATGRPPSEIWLTAGQGYKFVLMDALNNIIATYDNISGINDILLPIAVSEWLPSNLTPTYVNATSFTLVGTQTAIFLPNLRIKSVNTGGTIYSTVQTATFNLGTGLTTVVINNDSGILDSGLSSVSYSLLNPVYPSIPGEYLAFNSPAVAAVTSTPVIGASASANITLTGSGVTITAFDSALAGTLRYVKFTGNNALTNSSTLVLQQAPTMSVQAGDEMVFRSLGTSLGWELIQFTPSMNNYALSGNHTLANTDKGQRLTCTGTMTLSGTASSLGSGWFCYVENDGAGAVTFSSAGTNIYQVGGPTAAVASITIPDSGTGANPYNNSMVLITTDGTNFNVCPVSTPHGSTTFLASGSWVSPRGVFSVWLTGSGGGGVGGTGGNSGGGGNFGGSGGGGGGSGQKSYKTLVSVVPGTTYTVTIGGSAANTTFGALLTLTKGANGTNGTNASSSLINTGSDGGDGGINGGSGKASTITASVTSFSGGDSGYGTASSKGGLNSGSTINGNAGEAGAANTGNGGGGGSGGGTGSGAAGGAGGSGYLIVEW